MPRLSRNTAARELVDVEDYLERRKATDLNQATVHSVLESLWGEAEPYESTEQDGAGLFSSWMYSWIYPAVMTAAEEKLTNEALPKQQKYMRCYESGKKISRALQRARYRRSVWDTLVGCAVTSRLDCESRGTLRWVGVPQQGKYSGVMAGVEWSVAPKIREAHRSDLEINPFFDGVAYGEHLFEPETPGMSTLEYPKDIIFSVPRDTGIPSPPLPKRLALLRVLIGALYQNFLHQAPFAISSLAAGLSAPIILQQYVKYLESPEKTWFFGFVLVGLVFLSSTISSIARHRNFFFCLQSGTQFRAALTSSVFEKCFSVSVKALAHPELHAGRIINMLSTDVEHAFYFFLNVEEYFTIPVTVIVSLGMLCNIVGFSALWGLIIMIICGFANAWVLTRSATLEEKLSGARDLRIKSTNEFISGIRVTKFMTWEHRFVSEIQARRDVELHYIRLVQLLDVFSAFLGNASPSLMIAVIFIMYYSAGNTLTPTVVFPTIALMNVLCSPFRTIPWVVQDTLRFMISIKRLTRFFESEDRLNDTVKNIDFRGDPLTHEPSSAAACFESADITAYVPSKLPCIPDARIGFLRRTLRVFLRCPGCRPARIRPLLIATPEENSDPTTEKRRKKHQTKAKKKADPDDVFEVKMKVLLHDVDVEVPRGKLTLVIGPTGCGKSTLVQSLLSQLEVSKGRVWATKSIAYVPQQPWIMNATVRENVLFFAEEDPDRLREALRVSQLETDLGLMANGLETEIGEKGINLSGGQKARVSLARAVYADREMYLLDDPLSALDAHVGEKVVQECLLGKLAGKTRVLATHHMHVLKHADYVVALGEHRVVFSGDRESFLNSEAYAKMRHNDDVEKSTHAVCEADETISSASSEEVEERETQAGAEESADNAGHLMTEEEKAVGSVPIATYIEYFRYCGGLRIMSLILGVFAVTEVFTVASTVWISMWSTDALGLEVSTYLKGYIVLILLGACSIPLRSYSSFTIMREGSRKLHNSMLRSVSSSTMEFFDTTPIGRLLNRFSHDIDVTDGQLISEMVGFLESVCGMISSVAIMVVSAPLLAVFLVPAGYIYYRILVLYNSANREIRRFTSNIRSPLLSNISEVINGIGTLKAYDKTTVMMQRAIQQMELISSTTLLEVTTNRWLAVRIELGASIMVSALAFSGVFISRRSAHSNVAVIALALTISMQITTQLNWIVRHAASVEASMNSVQRLLHYIHHIPHEEMPDLDDDIAALRETPQKAEKPIITDALAVEPELHTCVIAGSLEFRGVQMRYREGLPLVLKDVTFRIAPREKVGIVGRTGSGKSTLMLTFMRMVDICGGEILVNGSGIRTYPLRELRRQFSMIPQDPVLFDGTVRQNLDPFQESSVEEVEAALTLCGLRDRIAAETGGLEGRVLEGGSNFSVGQRQLLCMARALLRKGSGFILMDEATANIDPTLDRYIQSTVMSAFAEYTVITIAHRLHTVANYDKIIVMDQGVVAETGTPQELVSNRQSIFRGMVESMGNTGMNEFLRLLKG